MVMKNNRKAQMKIQQMMFMIMGVFFLFMLVGMFFISIYMSNLKGDAEELQKKNALLLVSKLAKSPEFSCGESFGTQSTYCVDFDKVIWLAELDKDYKDFWGVDKIQIKKITDNSNISCNLENYPNCGVLTIIDKNSSLPSSSSFIALCRKERTNSSIYNKCDLAKLYVSGEDL